MGYRIEPVADHSHPPAHLIVQLRCPLHPGSDLEQDVEEGIRHYGLHGLVDGRSVAYDADPAKRIVIGKEEFVDVRLYEVH